MARIEPPRLAAWLLDNLIPRAERDEALAGDLEEYYRAGRSDGWYWRQATAAVATGWAQYLSRRGAMLVFALLWSTLAPAWQVTVNGIEDSHDLWNRAWPLAFVGWTGLSAAFLWAGLMVYQLVHTWIGKPILRKDLRRAFWKVPLVFLPVAGVTFVITALFQYSVPGLANPRLSATSWGQITDFGIFADVIRIPYFVALSAALWGTIYRYGGSLRSVLADAVPEVARDGARVDEVEPVPWDIGRFFAFVVAAGVINALLSGFLVCRLPESYAPSLSSLLVRAAIYVALGAASGAAGAWIYWNNPASPFRDSAPINFRLFALAGAAGWAWMPALILFYQQVTALTALVAAVAAFALAAALREIPIELDMKWPSFARGNSDEPELFSDTFLRPRSEGTGMLIAIAIYAGGFAIVDHSFLGASMLLGLATFLVGWRRTVPRRKHRSHEVIRAALRLAAIALPAVLVTAWALLDGVAYRNHRLAVSAAQAASGNPNSAEKAAAKTSLHGLGGYESVILWPWPEKKQIVAPILTESSFLAPGTTRPLTIRFDGPYWYLQPPDQRPGSDAHQAHGSPLGVRIEANNSLPLVMEARQRLGESIPLTRCGRIEVELENRDEHLGVVAVVLLLEDSSAKNHLQLDAGRQQLVTGEPETSGPQSFQFPLPLHGPIRRFDSVTVMLLPESGHDRIGPRVAVRELRLYPR